MGPRRWLLPLAFVIGTTMAGTAHAAPSARDRTDAAVLTTKARAASKAKRNDEAVDLLRKAEQLDPQPQRKIELAKLLVPMNKLVEASSVLNGVINDTSLGAKDKWLKDSATKQLAQFESRIPWLSVHVIGPTQGVHVEVDGKEVEPDAESPVDPGDHAVGVDAEGYESADSKATIAEAEHKQVTITMVAVTKAQAPKPKATGGTVWPAVAAFGVGAVGIAVGTAFGVLAFDETAKAKQFCDGNICPARLDVIEARNLAIANGNVSTVGFVFGGVGVAAGIVLAVTVGSSSSKPAAKKDAIFVTPYVGPGEVGFVGKF